VLTHSSDQRHAETDAAAPSKNQGQNLGMGGCHGLLLTKRVGMSSRLGAGACSSSSVPRTAAGALDDRGRPFLCEEKPPPTKYEGRAVESGSESGMTGFARTTASEVLARAFLRPSRARSRGPWLAPKAIQTARAFDTEAALVKNEGASPLTDARTDRVEEGSDDAT
jgi:hypothetical protein